VLNFESQDVQKAKAFEEAREFAEERVRGVMLERDALDARIEPRLKNWSLYRLGAVERNVLRLGFWELENCPEIPAPIVINEHVDLAKFFSETKSGRFVNGLLDRYAKSLKSKSAQDGETFMPR
jgi:N utilization substance protein B